MKPIPWNGGRRLGGCPQGAPTCDRTHLGGGSHPEAGSRAPPRAPGLYTGSGHPEQGEVLPPTCPETPEPMGTSPSLSLHRLPRAPHPPHGPQMHSPHLPQHLSISQVTTEDQWSFFPGDLRRCIWRPWTSSPSPPLHQHRTRCPSCDIQARRHPGTVSHAPRPSAPNYSHISYFL